MIIGQGAFVAYQIAIFIWFCVGIAVVGFFSIRDLIRMLKDNSKKEINQYCSIFCRRSELVRLPDFILRNHTLASLGQTLLTGRTKMCIC